MASFELTEEYQDLSDSVREFADEVVALCPPSTTRNTASRTR
ncbi:acyl-Coa dehydrogenase [Arthrobacter sp. Hiyo8]|nr:acyl-Coa dehydrogenase [Arthrobacter sp. Hiyo8]